jgi:hypothetical protein
VKCGLLNGLQALGLRSATAIDVQGGLVCLGGVVGWLGCLCSHVHVEQPAPLHRARSTGCRDNVSSRDAVWQWSLQWLPRCVMWMVQQIYC